MHALFAFIPLSLSILMYFFEALYAIVCWWWWSSSSHVDLKPIIMSVCMCLCVQCAEKQNENGKNDGSNQCFASSRVQLGGRAAALLKNIWCIPNVILWIWQFEMSQRKTLIPQTFISYIHIHTNQRCRAI